MATTARVGVDITARDLTGRAFSAVQGKIAGMERALEGAKRVMGSFAVATVGAAFGAAMKSAIDRMDDMGKAAQRMGVGVENLSRLGLAAKLSDVSLEQLGTSFGKLNRNMAAIASGDGGEAGRAFKALGISVTEASGKLKSGDVVMQELADRFSRMQDGAGKSAIAMAIFGKSGADMIPLLNGGAAAMRELGDEADRTGQTISESTARNAEVLNDNIARLYGRSEGFANLLAQKLIPDLIDMSDRLLGVADSAGAAEGAMGAWDELKRSAQDFYGQTKAEWNGLVAVGSAAKDILSDWSMPAEEATRRWNAALAESKALMQDAMRASEMLRQQVERTGKGSLPSTVSGTGVVTPLGSTPFIPSVQKRPKVDREHNAALAEAKRIYEGTRSAAETYGDTLTRLDELKAKGLISQDTYNRALFQANWALQESKVAGDAWQDTLEKQSTPMRDVADILQGEFMSAFDSIISGTQSAKKAFGDMARSILRSLASMAANKLLTNLFGSLLGGGAPTHALYGGALPSFAVGTTRVPRDMVAQIHKDEMVIPARQADAIRSRGGGGGGLSVQIIDQRVNAPPIDKEEVDGTIRFIVRDEIRQQVPGAVRRQLGNAGIGSPAIRRAGA